MAVSFFNSWALWEKMTFVLALAIAAVFAIGYGKLAWKNREVKIKEQGDEEKRIRIQELRASGQLIEPRRSNDIPFGVRAIQSGIQIDGIWISNTSTPIPSSLKTGHPGGNTSDSTSASSPLTHTLPSIETSQQIMRPTSHERSLFRKSELDGLSLDQSTGLDSTTIDPLSPTGHRSSYKPRRSSHLRFGSYGETQYDEETLDQLEGRVPTPKAVLSRRPRDSRQIATESSSSFDAAADNERCSGTSSDSDATFSGNIKELADDERHSLTPQYPTRNSSLQTSPVALVGPNRLGRFSEPRVSGLEYCSETRGAFDDEREDRPKIQQFTAMDAPTSDKSSNAPTTPYPASSAEPQLQRLSKTLSPSLTCPSFLPGELHLGKTVRKVNSGFEVLPAGTFGIPATFKEKGVDHGESWNQDDDTGEKRFSNKLQKKNRTSINLGRPSSTMERL